MAAGVQAVKEAMRTERITVWIPGYFCNEALEPMRRLTVNLEFYRIKEDLTPDWEMLEDRVTRGAVLMLVHYFGFPNAPEAARDFCDRHGLVLLEDAAHVLLPGPPIGSGDLSVFSPRKLLSVPAGGILVLPEDWAAHLPDGFTDLLARETLIWFGKRLTQKIFVSLHVPWHRLKAAEHPNGSTDNVSVTAHGGLAGCDPFALKLLTVMERDADEIVALRRHNYGRLLDRTRELIGARPMSPGLPDAVCPYAFPLLVDRGVGEVVTRLQSQGIPAMRWPDLAPEVVDNGRDHEVAIRTYERLLLLPIHQSLSSKQIDLMIERLRTAVSDIS